MKNGIPKTISRLTLATKKISSKNLTQLALSVTEKAATTISKVFSIMPSILCTSTFIGLMERPSSHAKVG